MTTCLLVLAPHAAGAESETYVQPVNVEWDTRVLDVLIFSPGHGQIYNANGPLGGEGVNELTPYENSYLRAMERSIAAWDTAIETLAPDWLREGLVTNVYVVGRDTIPQPAVEDPEILITTSHSQGVILGWALQSNLDGQRCVINNSKFFVLSFSYEDMYNVNAHEYGHCLGLGHSYGQPEDEVIEHDVMHGTYMDAISSTGTHRHCVSNLNMLGLEKAFAPLFKQPEADAVATEPAAYRRVTC